ncbi:MAG: hypothetical protein AMXMBFR84_48990 [Candidatus Hydrogenedentota bacterium]
MEIARYHYGADLRRPFLFPVMGPSGRPVTRIGHPHDPVDHSHHNSIWISHEKVGGFNFWADKPETRIAHQKVTDLVDGDTESSLTAENIWLNEDKPVIYETRTIRTVDLGQGEWLMVFDLTFTPAGDEVLIDDSGFGMLAVRMAKTMGVNDGGGTIRNSEGAVNGEAVFRKPARWVDYSGPVATGVIEGITFMDHPSNPNHPSPFHVRDDGWMGSSLTLGHPIVILKGSPLNLRYGLYVHAGLPPATAIEERWNVFAATTVPHSPPKP